MFPLTQSSILGHRSWMKSVVVLIMIMNWMHIHSPDFFMRIHLFCQIGMQISTCFTLNIHFSVDWMLFLHRCKSVLGILGMLESKDVISCLPGSPSHRNVVASCLSCLSVCQVFLLTEILLQAVFSVSIKSVCQVLLLAEILLLRKIQSPFSHIYNWFVVK